jgi:hypothetical protein
VSEVEGCKRETRRLEGKVRSARSTPDVDVERLHSARHRSPSTQQRNQRVTAALPQ